MDTLARPEMSDKTNIKEGPIRNYNFSKILISIHPKQVNISVVDESLEPSLQSVQTKDTSYWRNLFRMFPNVPFSLGLNCHKV